MLNLLFVPEAVSDAAYGLYHVPARAKLLTDGSNVNVNVAVDDKRVIADDSIQEMIAGKNPSGVGREKVQQP